MRGAAVLGPRPFSTGSATENRPLSPLSSRPVVRHLTAFRDVQSTGCSTSGTSPGGMHFRGDDDMDARGRRLTLLPGLVRWALVGGGPLAVALLMTALITVSRGAVAQDAPPSPPAAQAAEEPQPEVVSEEITVTARKREETIQEVPFSVAAPSEEELRSRGAQDIEGVAANVAGFSVQNLGPGQSQVAMR